MATLILFTKIPGLTPAKTRLSSEALNAEARSFLAAAFLADSLELAFETLKLREDKDTFYISSSPLASKKILLNTFKSLPISKKEIDWSEVHFHEQQDVHFGERLQQTIQECTHSPQGVVIFGSDSPLLSPAVLADALSTTEKGNACIGPSQGGGLYLMGLSQKEASFDMRSVFSSDITEGSDIERFTQHWESQKKDSAAGLEILLPNFDIDVAEDLLLAASILSATKTDGVLSKNGKGENLRFALDSLQLELQMSSENNRVIA